MTRISLLILLALPFTVGSVAVSQHWHDAVNAEDVVGRTLYVLHDGADDVRRRWHETRYFKGIGSEWKAIGEVEDISLAPEGTMSALIFGIGGVLGLAEREVELPKDNIRIVADEGKVKVHGGQVLIGTAERNGLGRAAMANFAFVTNLSPDAVQELEEGSE
ncbi:PRC-barrel domain-containing protein [Tranquillimonas alkanivorans]|uniref:PRC-barrel domain-containing protein n=1 Tax=Tranquillimonas alkanivorans TaxID=441119 RepID=A0A1I5U979_9RHOB|nr:PRC-barrel domain-containing protein [Tranquillimonas alkanivorans]SFP91507.1 PRC-barrel domain-containing protein [Tranquillimonas alkanivorans]